MGKNSFRILLTEKCNANCPSCFNANYRVNKELDFERLDSLSAFLSDNGIKSLKIMGGEPTVYSHYKEAIAIFKKYFYRVTVFTNAVNDNIYLTQPRESDCIIYNFNFINSNFNLNKLLLNEEGSRGLEIQIASNTNIDNYFPRLERVYKEKDAKNKIGVNITLNCMEDIYENKEILIQKWNKLVDYLEHENITYKIDHIIPQCFFKGSQMQIDERYFRCSPKCAGLIDTDFNLRYCNQFPIVLGSIKEDNKYISFEKMTGLLQDGYKQKMGINEGKNCINCSLYSEKCNGGCFFHKPIIKRYK